MVHLSRRANSLGTWHRSGQWKRYGRVDGNKENCENGGFGRLLRCRLTSGPVDSDADEGQDEGAGEKRGGGVVGLTSRTGKSS